MDAVFLKILNMSITAACIALAVTALRFLLKKAPRWISYALWSIVLFRLICPVSFPSALSLLGRFGAPVAEGGAMIYIPKSFAPSMPALADAMDSVWLTLGVAVWLLGMAAMLCYSLAAHLSLKRKIADATRVEGNVYETDAIASPFVYGILKPRIYLPLGLSEAERRYVLLHERTHIARRDYLVKPFALLTLAVHWFNPVVWFAFKLMNLDMEMSCDERVIREFNRQETADYGEALLRLRVKRPLVAGSPVAFNENGTTGRIRNVLNYKKPAFWAVALAVAAAAVACVCLVSNPKREAEGTGEGEALATLAPTEPAATPAPTDTSIVVPPGVSVVIAENGNVTTTIAPEMLEQMILDHLDEITAAFVYDVQQHTFTMKPVGSDISEYVEFQKRLLELELSPSPEGSATP